MRVLGVVQDLAEQLADVIVVQRIDDVPTVALACDEGEVAQDAQVVGDGVLLKAGCLSELADRAR